MPSGSVVVPSTHEVYSAVLPDYVVVTSTATDSIVATITVGQLQSPNPFLYSGWASLTTPIVYDPFTGDVIVGDFVSNSLTAINVSSHKVVAQIHLEAPPYTMALNGANGELFVGTDFSNGTIAAFEIAGNSTDYPTIQTRWTSLGASYFAPTSMIVDQADQKVFFTAVQECDLGCYGSSLDWFSYTSNASGTTDACALGTSIAFDPLTDEIYLPAGATECCIVSAGCLAIAVIAASTLDETTTINGPGEPMLGFDPTTGQVLAASAYSVYVIDPTNHSLVSAYRDDAECPSAISVGQGQGDAYVTDECGDELVDVSVASGASRDIVIAGSGPASVTFDPTTNDVIVANQGAGNASFLSTETETVLASIGGIPGADSVTLTPATGHTYVAGWNGIVGDLDDQNMSLTTTIHLGTWLAPTPVSAFDPVSDEVLIGGTNDTETILYGISDSLHTVESPLSLGINYYYPEGLAYDAANHSLLLGTAFSDAILELNPTNLSAVGQLSLPSDDFGVNALAIDPSTDQVYVSTTIDNASAGYPGAIAVFNATSGARISQTITFATFLSLTFDPNGNEMVGAASLNGTVSIFNATTYQVSRNISVGEGPDAMAYDNLTGALYVANYLSDSITLITRNLTYPVSVTETGLPTDENWTVRFDGSMSHSNSSWMEFTAANGTYSFWVGGVAGFIPSPASGTVLVDGLPVTQNVTFSAFTFSLTFSESGLPGGTKWAVTLSGVDGHSDTQSLVFAVPNGTYAFFADPVPGYSVIPQSGNASIQNGSRIVVLTYTPITPIHEIPIWVEVSVIVIVGVSMAALVLVPPRPPRAESDVRH